VLTYPVYERLNKRLEGKWKPKPGKPPLGSTIAALIVVICTVMPVLLAVGGIGFVATQQAGNLIDELNAQNPGRDTTENLAAELDRRLAGPLQQFGIKNFDSAAYVRQNGAQMWQKVADPVTTFAKKAAIGIVSMVIALVTMFYMIRDGHKLTAPTCDIVPLPREETMKILRHLVLTIRQVAIGVVCVAAIQGAIVGCGLAAMGVKGAVLWGFLTFIFGCVPLLGPPIVYVPLGLSLLLSGETAKGFIVLAVGFGFISQIDNLLRPYFIKAGLPTIGLFFALITGVVFFGPVGLMAGPMLLALLLSIVDILRRRRAISDADVEDDNEYAMETGDAAPST
jgi:predicted PurR-regulated permease PerM